MLSPNPALHQFPDPPRADTECTVVPPHSRSPRSTQIDERGAVSGVWGFSSVQALQTCRMEWYVPSRCGLIIPAYHEPTRYRFELCYFVKSRCYARPGLQKKTCTRQPRQAQLRTRGNVGPGGCVADTSMHDEQDAPHQGFSGDHEVNNHELPRHRDLVVAGALVYVHRDRGVAGA